MKGQDPLKPWDENPQTGKKIDKVTNHPIFKLVNLLISLVNIVLNILNKT